MKSRRPWFFGPLIGALIGLVVLGVGGRVAMRGIAMHDGAGGILTLQGTITVMLLGAASGAGGGIIRALLDIGDRLPNSVRFSLFAVTCLAITLRGLNPLDLTRIIYFLPLVALYAVSLKTAWQRLRWLRRSPELPDSTTIIA